MYKRYHIDRNEEIKTIKEIIEKRDYYKENSQKGISILINGDWGSGKTTFVNDMCKKIDSKKYTIIKYDAFEYDFYDNPFIPIFSFLHDKLKIQIDVNKLTRITSKQIGKVLLNSSYTIVNTLFKFKTGKSLDGFKKEMEEVKKKFDEENDAYNEFKELEKIKKDIKKVIKDKARKKPIIFVIDELDRCNPRFAIGTLEILKYFLDINNFVILLSLDEKQLQESVKTIYGQEINSDVYFSKFFDYKFNLSKLTFSSLLDQSSIDYAPDIMPSIDHIFNTLNISLRDSHKIFIEFLRKYKMYNKSKKTWTKNQSIFIILMITLKNTDLLIYNSIVNCNFSNYKKVLMQNDSIEKKKYLEVLTYTFFGENNLENTINDLNSYSNEKYIDLKYLEYVDSFDNKEMIEKKKILNKMSFFLPQVLNDKSYLENFLEIME